MKAFLKNYRQSPRKVRIVASLVRGKSVDQALVELDFLAKRASEPLRDLVLSAVANARANFGIEKENLVIKEFRVDKGVVMKRIMPAAMGSAHRINKRNSHVTLVLEEKGAKSNKTEKKEKEAKKEEKDTEEKSEKKVTKKKAVKKVAKIKK